MGILFKFGRVLIILLGITGNFQSKNSPFAMHVLRYKNHAAKGAKLAIANCYFFRLSRISVSRSISLGPAGGASASCFAINLLA